VHCNIFVSITDAVEQIQFEKPFGGQPARCGAGGAPKTPTNGVNRKSRPGVGSDGFAHQSEPVRPRFGMPRLWSCSLCCESRSVPGPAAIENKAKTQ
jgi:hypothetical protein